MIIALPTVDKTENTKVSEHFGRSNCFFFYDTDQKTFEVIENKNKDGQGGVGIKSSEFILDKNTDVLITPRLGEKALRVIKDSGVTIMKTVDKTALENIELYFKGELEGLF